MVENFCNKRSPGDFFNIKTGWKQQQQQQQQPVYIHLLGSESR